MKSIIKTHSRLFKLAQGFTLLEVLVALSICAMAGIASMQVAGEHINHLSTLEQQTYASWVAENRLVEIVAKGDDWSGKNGERGQEEIAGHAWYWQQKIIATTAGSSFVKVTVEVYSDEELKNSLYELSTYVNKGGK